MTGADFRGPLSVGNPLDEAFLVIRDYWNRLDLAGDQGDAYPLIVVRPGGTQMYALLRHAIKSWDDEFGYELVADGVEIDFGKADPGLAEKIRQAIAKSRRRQLSLAQQRSPSGPASRGRPSTSGFRASGTRGGLVDDSGRPADLSLLDTPTTQRPAQRPFGQRRREASTEQTARMVDQRIAESSANSESMATQGNEGGGASLRSSPTSIASQRGENWALPTRSPGAIGYVRGIQIRCLPEELVVTQADESTARIPVPDTTRAVVGALVDQVWEVVESWGVAGAGSYWKLELRIEVAPGAEQRFAELGELLEGSGIVVRRIVR